MAPTIKTLTALAALLMALPSASALAATHAADAALPPSLDPNALLASAGGQADSGGKAATDTLRAVSDTADRATGTLAVATQPILDLATNSLSCRPAVHVKLDWFGGRVTDSRDGSGSFLVPYTLVSKQTIQVPRLETVTETVWSAGSVLDAFVAPITRTTTRVIGDDVQTVVTQTPADLWAMASWREDYIVWSAYYDDWYVSPLASLPATPGMSHGAIELQCDPSAVILGSVPDPWRAGVDTYCLCASRPVDGWYVSIVSLDVNLANAQQYRTAWASPASAPTVVADAAIAKAGVLSFTPDQLARQAQDRADAGRPDAPTASRDPAIAPQTSTCSTLNVPLSTGLMLGTLGVSILAALGLGAHRIVRRKA
ncbi:MAG: hypothetical protein V4510_13265 [bacterium]